jgi:hypothetical protein
VAASADVLAVTDAGVVVGLRWRAPDRDEAIEMFQVLRLRDGRIVDIEDHDRRRPALSAVGAKV